MKTISIVAKIGKPEAVPIARELKARHPELTFLAEPHLAIALGWPQTAPAELGAKCDLLVVLGGDGMLIQGARHLKGRAVPILGVNLGSLGFMTEISQKDATKAFDELLAGKAKIDYRNSGMPPT